jgi:hypothetical protein
MNLLGRNRLNYFLAQTTSISLLALRRTRAYNNSSVLLGLLKPFIRDLGAGR